jgi:hypothetical protein
MASGLILGIWLGKQDSDKKAISTLLGCHHEETARNEGDLLAPTLRALRFHRFMLGNGLVALEAFSAFLARY